MDHGHDIVMRDRLLRPTYADGSLPHVYGIGRHSNMTFMIRLWRRCDRCAQINLHLWVYPRPQPCANCIRYSSEQAVGPVHALNGQQMHPDAEGAYWYSHTDDDNNNGISMQHACWVQCATLAHIRTISISTAKESVKIRPNRVYGKAVYR